MFCCGDFTLLRRHNTPCRTFPSRPYPITVSDGRISLLVITNYATDLSHFGKYLVQSKIKLELTLYRSSWTPAQGSKEQRPQAGAGGFYSHLDMESVHDALLDVEGNLDLGIAVDTASGFQTNTLPITYRMSHRKRPTFLMEDETWAGDELYQIRFRDKSGLLKDTNLIEMVQFILQTRLQVANRIVKDEWEIDGQQLVRALQSRCDPSQNISSFDDQVQRLPMAPTKMNKELVRTRKAS